jgi:hypothetical protein
MAKARKIVSWAVGGIQCGLGGLASVFAYLVYASQPIKDMLAITAEEMPLYVFLLMMFSIFSILSGVLLVRRNGGG